ncbi:MAG TPA: MBL fold metallo-hydrolase [Gaiellaceae bacterium]|nr:MBL fold metallo-hydrolase [Gaiellaceae bacterium]
MEEVADGVIRVTFDLPLGIDHVHCYFLRASSGGWTLVDTGLGSRDPEEKWRPVLDELDAPVERIVVTHMHPDHVGGARDVADLTGAPVLQGREDYAQCVSAWGADRSLPRLAGWWESHGLPAGQAEAMRQEADNLGRAVHWVRDPQLLDEGDTVDDWRVGVLRGHADGHIVLSRGDVMIAGDTILGGITPAIGQYPNSRPDPLGDYLETLDRIEAMQLSLALTGHKHRLRDPSARAREIRAHHHDRLVAAEAALGDAPRTAYEVSLELFEAELSPVLRRFALAEALAHLERLVVTDRAVRADGGYTAR